MARGLEGCGVTKFSLEQREWFNKHGHDATIVYANDIGFTRNKAHDYKNVTTPVKLGEDYDTAIKLVNDCDILIINSVPAISVPESTKSNYLKLIDNISPSIKVVVYQHDHRILSLRRNIGLKETVKRADVIFSHSSKGDFNTKLMPEFFPAPNLMDMFSDDVKTIPVVHNFQPAMNIRKVRDAHWKDDISNTEMNVHRWIGRTTSWKGYNLMFDFHDKVLRPNKQITILEGLERSPAFITVKRDYTFDYHRYYKDMKPGIDMNAQAVDRYVNKDMLERMSMTGFGYQLSKLPPNYFERSLEYTHLELIASGTIPVFRKEAGDNLLHRTKNIPLTECDSGIIWLTSDNYDESFELMKELASDKKLYNSTREKAFEFILEHQDSEQCFKEQFDIITA